MRSGPSCFTTWPCVGGVAVTMLYLIGLGLGDAKDITVKGLEIVKQADRVYLEAYTSLLTIDKEQLVKCIDKLQRNEFSLKRTFSGVTNWSLKRGHFVSRNRQQATYDKTLTI